MKRLIITFDTDIMLSDLREMVDNAICFVIEEAVDDRLFRHAGGSKNYRKCNYTITEVTNDE